MSILASSDSERKLRISAKEIHVCASISKQEEMYYFFREIVLPGAIIEEVNFCELPCSQNALIHRKTTSRIQTHKKMTRRQLKMSLKGNFIAKFVH